MKLLSAKEALIQTKINRNKLPEETNRIGYVEARINMRIRIGGSDILLELDKREITYLEEKGYKVKLSLNDNYLVSWE